LHADVDDGRFDALRLLEECLERNAAWIVAHGDDALDPAAYECYAAALERRALGEPLAYIFGTAGFYGRTFAVTRDVLVPRPETEQVVALALDALRERGSAAPPPRLCDVGTGSGILAITLACEWPAAEVTAIDISSQALAVAARNAHAHGVAARVRFLLGDMFGRLAPGERFDCIVANLPYVKSADLGALPEPTAFEPALALDGGGDGLAVYRRLLASARERLTDPGVAMFEAGPDTAGPLAELARAAFPGCGVTVHRDYAGRERIVEVRRGSLLPSEKTSEP
jgi:release factor glutamine methyltransferase